MLVRYLVDGYVSVVWCGVNVVVVILSLTTH